MGSISLSAFALCLVAGLAFSLATENFYSAGHLALRTEIRGTENAFGDPTSPLLGRVPDELATNANNQRQRDAEWVEVTDAVNMRSGSSSSNSVIKVQLEGERLRVASREGGWVEVVEPETQLTGWVYEQYVKPVEPESKQAGLVDAER